LASSAAAAIPGASIAASDSAVESRPMSHVADIATRVNKPENDDPSIAEPITLDAA